MTDAKQPEMVVVEIPESLAKMALITHAGFTQMSGAELFKLQEQLTGRRVLKKATAKAVGELCAVVGFAFIMQLDAARQERLKQIAAAGTEGEA